MICKTTNFHWLFALLEEPIPDSWIRLCLVSPLQNWGSLTEDGLFARSLEMEKCYVTLKIQRVRRCHQRQLSRRERTGFILAALHRITSGFWHTKTYRSPSHQLRHTVGSQLCHRYLSYLNANKQRCKICDLPQSPQQAARTKG